jgi:transposase
MVDAETGDIVDMLESRESSEVSEWLATFPNIEVVSRDGSMLYAKAISMAHPDAMQVSDRFHILKGLTDAARQFVFGIVGQRIAIPSDTVPSSYWLKQPRCDTDLPKRLHNATTEKRTASVREVRDLAAKGLNQKQIYERTGHCSTTIKKYLDPDFDPEYKEYGVNYPSKLKPYCETIDTMLNEHKKFREIEEKIRAMGYQGSASTIRMYSARKRRHNQAIMAEYRQNTEIVERKYLLKLLYNSIEKVRGMSQEQFDKVIALYPQLLAVYDLIRDLKTIFANHHADDLEPWLESAKSLGSTDINSFVNGINRDIEAVRNAIIYNYNNGLAEGSVNKIKRIKHTMYGKASFATLRTKVLLGEEWRRIN